MRSGFTLLELLIVMAIIAILTGIAAVRLQGPYQAARLEDALHRIEFLDCQARTHARSFAAECAIIFQLEQGRMYSQNRRGNGGRHFEFALPRSLRIDRVMTPQLVVERGQASIPVSAHGASPTYAICVRTPQDTQRWLLFSGLTGRVAYPKDEKDVQRVFDILQTPGPDTH